MWHQIYQSCFCVLIFGCCFFQKLSCSCSSLSLSLFIYIIYMRESGRKKEYLSNSPVCIYTHTHIYIYIYIYIYICILLSGLDGLCTAGTIYIVKDAFYLFLPCYDLQTYMNYLVSIHGCACVCPALTTGWVFYERDSAVANTMGT